MDLRIRASEDLSTATRRIEVLAPDGTVVGDLSRSVGGCAWKMGIAGPGMLTLELLAEQASVESVDLRSFSR